MATAEMCPAAKSEEKMNISENTKVKSLNLVYFHSGES